MNLKDCFDRYKCDKGYKHHYHIEYEKEFSKVRNKEINFLEIGVYKGASTSAWHDYLPRANLYCVDIFERVDVKNIEVLNRERVHWLKSDSTTIEFKKEIKNWIGDLKFDFIIDDGLHTHTANEKTFTSLIDFLKDDGIYYIEDIYALDVMTKMERNNYWTVKQMKLGNIGDIQLGSLKSKLTNYNLKEISTRHLSRFPDSHIYKIRK
mgnify:CR=1 FL=1